MLHSPFLRVLTTAKNLHIIIKSTKIIEAAPKTRSSEIALIVISTLRIIEIIIIRVAIRPVLAGTVPFFRPCPARLTNMSRFFIVWLYISNFK